MEATQTLNLSDTYVHLSDSSDLTPFEGGDTFWQTLEAPVDLDQGRMVCVTPQRADWLVWERHPQGDELIMLLDGKIDLVLEMLANVNLDRDLDVLAFRGRVMVVGNRGRIEIDPRKIMSKDAAILGMTMFNTTADEYRTIHAALAPGLENGSLTPVTWPGRQSPCGRRSRSSAAAWNCSPRACRSWRSCRHDLARSAT